ncbi:YggS family pyridoxal phosphate-dependent enzyme [bacterium]|nr:YggS family pyridoxal phosphate-dependent enzyme [bacterium]
MIAQNLEKIKKEIKEACAACSRNPESITLIAVSKTKPITAILEAKQAGQNDFGENYTHELIEKYQPDIRFHFIGHLQSRKVKDVIGKTVLIHTLDSLKLAKEINKQAAKLNIVQECLIQVMVEEEKTKSGINPDDLPILLKECSALSHIKITGLMCIPPPEQDPEKSRPYFKTMKQLADKNQISELSMGMSHDFKVAIEEGATMIRVGTAIFGKRN